jgi:hypothetical protein
VKYDPADTAVVVSTRRTMSSSVGWINAIPGGPFPTQMVEAVTGTPIGLQRLDR